MKKILEKDRKNRKKGQYFEKQKIILQLIFNNFYINSLIRLNALSNSSRIIKKSSKAFFNNICVYSLNKKKLIKIVHFSRIIFRKIGLKKKISGVRKLAR